jgi:hypothetical protein
MRDMGDRALTFSPMWPGFDFQNGIMSVELFVGSLPSFKGFSPGSPVFFPA